MTALRRRFCIPALRHTTMEKLVENASLVNANIAGTPTATPVTPKKTKPTQCRKWSSLTVSASFGKNWRRWTHTLSARVATLFGACRSAVLGPFHVVSSYGGKGSCSESVMTAAARMALTFLWHGSYGGVSRLGCSAIWSWSSILSSSARQLCNRFCAEASSFKHHDFEQRDTPNFPDEIYR